MSDYDDDDIEQDVDDKPKRNWRRDLEERAREAETAKQEAAKAQRELAFLKAGIDLDTPQGKLFAKAYDGASTLDAVKAAAQEYGVLAPTTPQVPAEELQALDRVTQASAGGESSNEEYDALAEMEKAGDFFNGGSVAAVLDVLKKHGVPIDQGRPGNRWQRGGGPGTAATTPL